MEISQILTYGFSTITGEKISPIEVDAILLSHPDISEAVAFGVPDNKYGEEVRLAHLIFFLLWDSI